jgi:signal transduction histidine kinase
MQAAKELSASVLLVDDQPSDLAVLERHLAPFALHLVKATSGEEALQRLEDEDFALVLLVFLTGTPREVPSETNGYLSGAVDWLPKPVEPETLRAKVRVFVDLYRERESLRRQQHELHQREREVLEARSQRAEEDRERLLAELREAVRLRDEFLSVASHELKTPLTPLALRLQLLRQEVDREPESPRAPRLRGHLEAADRQVRRLTLLVDSLLDATRITRGRLQLRSEDDVNLAAIVRDVVANFEAQAACADCPLELELPARVLGHWDAMRLEQVVTNLLSNALKFGAGCPVLVRLEERDGLARLTVRDGGIGMDTDVRARLFGRFERGVSERHYGGLGLGLFISREIVRALGGHIHVESEPGRGATFTVELPCLPPGKDTSGGEVDP